MRYQQNFGEAHLSAADGVVAHQQCYGAPTTPAALAPTVMHFRFSPPK